MRIHKLTRVTAFPKKRLFRFNLGLGGFIVNGFLYNADTGSVSSPSFKVNGRRVVIVKGFGIHWKRLGVLLAAAVSALPADKNPEDLGS